MSKMLLKLIGGKAYIFIINEIYSLTVINAMLIKS